MATKVEVTENNANKNEMEIKLTNKANEVIFVQIKEIRDDYGCDMDPYIDPSYSLNYTLLDGKKKTVGEYTFPMVKTYHPSDFFLSIQRAAKTIKKRKDLDTVEAKVLSVATKKAIETLEHDAKIKANAEKNKPDSTAVLFLKNFLDKQKI